MQSGQADGMVNGQVSTMFYNKDSTQIVLVSFCAHLHDPIPTALHPGWNELLKANTVLSNSLIGKYGPWRDIAGVQVEGEAGEIGPGTDWQPARDLYLSKFLFTKDFEAELMRSSFIGSRRAGHA